MITTYLEHLSTNKLKIGEPSALDLFDNREYFCYLQCGSKRERNSRGVKIWEISL